MPRLHAPWVDQEPPSGDWSIEEVRAMYLAADQMADPWISVVDPMDWWQTQICFAYYTGLPVTALMSVNYSMINQWINVPARLSNRRKGKRQFLHPEAIEHNSICSQRVIILAWPNVATTKLGGGVIERIFTRSCRIRGFGLTGCACSQESLASPQWMTDNCGN